MWEYANLVNGRLVDDDGFEYNENWTSFETAKEANEWLEDNGLRITVR